MKPFTTLAFKISTIFLVSLIYTNCAFAGGEIGSNRLVSGDKDICQVFLDYSNYKIDINDPVITRFANNSGDKKLITPAENTYPVISLAAFDFNNDGILDQVFNLNGGGSFIAGDILFVKFGNKNGSPETKEFSFSEMSVFPCEFNKNIKSQNECEPFGEKGGATEVAIEFPFSNRKINFHNRYTEITPLGHKGKTYLLLNSTSHDSDLYNAVIETTPDKSFKPICLFEADPWHGN